MSLRIEWWGNRKRHNQTNDCHLPSFVRYLFDFWSLRNGQTSCYTCDNLLELAPSGSKLFCLLNFTVLWGVSSSSASLPLAAEHTCCVEQDFPELTWDFLHFVREMFSKTMISRGIIATIWVTMKTCNQKQTVAEIPGWSSMNLAVCLTFLSPCCTCCLASTTSFWSQCRRNSKDSLVWLRQRPPVKTFISSTSKVQQDSCLFSRGWRQGGDIEECMWVQLSREI